MLCLRGSVLVTIIALLAACEALAFGSLTQSEQVVPHDMIVDWVEVTHTRGKNDFCEGTHVVLLQRVHNDTPRAALVQYTTTVLVSETLVGPHKVCRWLKVKRQSWEIVFPSGQDGGSIVWTDKNTMCVAQGLRLGSC
jgi:hypothetical protein